MYVGLVGPIRLIGKQSDKNAENVNVRDKESSIYAFNK